MFTRSGHAARIARLQIAFESPDRYGRDIADWTGYTLQDVAGVLLRYLTSLPEPVMPYNAYDSSTRPLLSFTSSRASRHDATSKVLFCEHHSETVEAYQRCIQDLPPLNRQHLIYLLDVLVVYASQATDPDAAVQIIASVFNPALLSRRPFEMDETQHQLAQDGVIFLMWNHDFFLIGNSES